MSSFEWSRDHELFYCRQCGEVDVWDDFVGFLEKGIDKKSGREQASCPGCGLWVVPEIVGKFREPNQKIKRKILSQMRTDTWCK